MRNKAIPTGHSFVRRAVAVACAAALASCSGGGSSGANDPTSKKDEAGGSGDDTPDKPASLSGSYLADHMACVVPKVKKGDKFVTACCVLEDKAKVKIKLKGLPNDTFKIAPPLNKSLPAPKVEAVNLTAYPDHLCHVVYRAPVVGGAPAAGLNLSDPSPKVLDPIATIKGFLKSIPLFRKAKAPVTVVAPVNATKSASSGKSMLSGAGKKSSGPKTVGSQGHAGLALTDPLAAKPAPTSSLLKALDELSQNSENTSLKGAGEALSVPGAQAESIGEQLNQLKPSSDAGEGADSQLANISGKERLDDFGPVIDPTVGSAPSGGSPDEPVASAPSGGSPQTFDDIRNQPADVPVAPAANFETPFVDQGFDPNAASAAPSGGGNADTTPPPPSQTVPDVTPAAPSG